MLNYTTMELMKKIVFLLSIFFLTTYFLLFTTVSVVSADWPMVAGNPERTSWVNDSPSGTPHVEWYRPIDAFIPPNFQVIAANNLVYVSSARGLYAFAYDTGALVWRYDTELPLGNSPTIATVNGTSMAFVGGYDKKLHAFNALTGVHLWEFTGAKAGFDANPVVVNNVVYVGNRDGYFYAVNAQNGQLVWQYPAANQDGLGPLRQSPAYHNSALYFVSDHNYAYALNLNGTLKWKSAKLTSYGFYAYWPVVYTNPANNHDYVIFPAKIPYRENIRPGTRSFICDPSWTPEVDPNPCTSYSMYGDTNYLSDTPPGQYPQPITLPDPWAQGKNILDYSVVRDYLAARPYLKTYPVLDAINGTEAATLPAFPQLNPNMQAPPIITNDLLFISNDSGNGRHHIMGWKFGTPYFADTALDGAGDEPILLSGGGNQIYKVLCCSRAAWWTSLPNLNNAPYLWPYGGNSLGNIAPGYDEKLYYLDPSNPLDNISVIFGNVNGIYGYHGDNNPIVSYQGKLYTIKGNAIIAFGTGTNRGKLPLLNSASPPQTIPVPPDTELKNRLEKEILKFDANGDGALDLLKPGYQDDSQFASHYRGMANYLDSPGDTLITLSMAYPHLASATQTTLKAYLKNTLYPRYFQTSLVSRLGWQAGFPRDSIAYPAGLTADMQTLADGYTSTGLNNFSAWFSSLYFQANPNLFYGLWKYAALVAPEDTQSIYQQAVAILTTGNCQWSDCTHVPVWNNGTAGATDTRLITYPYELNAYIAGYQGFINLSNLANNPSADNQLRTNVTTELNRLKTLRINNFSKDTPFTTYQNGYGKNFLNLSRNFIWLTPELADVLRANKLSQVQTALDEYNTVGSYWFVSRFNAAAAESSLQNLYDYPSNFQARAWVLKQNRSELYKYLDVPAFARGDLFYIQNLVALLEAPGGSGPTATPGPSAAPSPTPTPTPIPGDANGDLHIDGLDYVVWLNHYNAQSVNGVADGDFDGNGTVDGLDYVVWLNNYGT